MTIMYYATNCKYCLVWKETDVRYKEGILHTVDVINLEFAGGFRSN